MPSLQTRPADGKLSKRCAFFLFILMGCGTASSATYHVSSTGLDTHPGTTQAPFREIRKALAVISPGDTVIVADGTYKGFNAVGIGSADTVTTIIAPGRQAEILKTTDRGINDPNNIVVWQCTNVVFDGFRSFNATRAGMRIIECSHVTVRNCVFGDNQYWGIVTSFSDDLLIEDNDCYGSLKEHGIYVANSGDRPIVRRNKLHDNVASGLRSNGDIFQGGDGIITGAVYEGNIIYNNGEIGGAAMNLDGLQDGIIRNNLIFDNLSTGIAIFKGGGAEGPKGMKVLNNTIILPATARYNLRITDVIGPILVRNNVLYNANTAKGPFSWNTPEDAAWTDSDYNAFGGGRFVSTDGEISRISMDTWRASGNEPHSLPSVALGSLFVDEPGRDYRLKAASPLIDTGTPLPEVPTDILGTARPLGSAHDIGAYEYGAYSSWKANQEFPPDTPIDWDSDEDGIPLLLEYALDMDPMKDSSPDLPTATLTNDRLQLVYPLIRTDLIYAVETSPDLLSWTTVGVDQGIPGSTVTASVPHGEEPERQFLRLQVWLP
ncbi:right-handed parallel beta-helix repeat-containing protein [Prosthecobacter sp. SYSU 5D2]|uniref:right-handed parallel beta-helix repeat-containing protein n=1 Tax=Prosthecobacter sp. SYSU 5D2 TaxID=3134134 RepID=UPI0031FEB765